MIFKSKKPKKDTPDEPAIDPAEWGYLKNLFADKTFYASLAIVAGWSYFTVGFGWQFAVLLLFGTLLVGLSTVDFKHMIIPDLIVIPGLILGLYLMPLFGHHVVSVVGGAMLGFLLFYFIRLIFYKMRGYHGMGFGDVKLLAMLGAWCGVLMLPLIILISSFAAIPVFIARRFLTSTENSEPLPYGPFLAFGGWLCFLYGHIFWSWIFTFKAWMINLI